jgi:hypothetical protein
MGKGTGFVPFNSGKRECGYQQEYLANGMTAGGKNFKTSIYETYLERLNRLWPGKYCSKNVQRQ